MRPVGRGRPVAAAPLLRVVRVEAGDGVPVGTAGGDGGRHRPVVHLGGPAAAAGVLEHGDAGEVERAAIGIGVVTPVLHVDHHPVPVHDVPLVDRVELGELLAHELGAPRPELAGRLLPVVVIHVDGVVGEQRRLRGPVLPHRADAPQVAEGLLDLAGTGHYGFAGARPPATGASPPGCLTNTLTCRIRPWSSRSNRMHSGYVVDVPSASNVSLSYTYDSRSDTCDTRPTRSS